MRDTESARELFINDRYAAESTGAVIDEARPGYARVSLKKRPTHLNAVGGIMGGVIYTIADYAFAIASNEPDAPVVGVDTSISFIGKARTDTLIAEAEIVKDGRTLVFAEITVRDDAGNLVARMQATGMKV